MSGTESASPHGDSPGTRLLRGRLALGALLAASTVLAYAGLRDHAFVNFDDNVFIYENPYLALGLGAEGLRWASTSLYAANWLPLTWLTLLVCTSRVAMAARWRGAPTLESCTRTL